MGMRGDRCCVVPCIGLALDTIEVRGRLQSHWTVIRVDRLQQNNTRLEPANYQNNLAQDHTEARG